MPRAHKLAFGNNLDEASLGVCAHGRSVPPGAAPSLNPSNCRSSLLSGLSQTGSGHLGTRLFGARSIWSYGPLLVSLGVSGSSLHRRGILSTASGLILLQKVNLSGFILFQELGQSGGLRLGVKVEFLVTPLLIFCLFDFTLFFVCVFVCFILE